MKKIIYSLVIMIAAGSLFTSCIEQVEPVGLLDMRTAKAEYIRALKDLRAADAEYVRAKAAVEQANARYVDAQTAYQNAVTENQNLLNELQALYNEAQEMENELRAAEIAAEIAELEMQIEKSLAEHAIEMVKAQAELAMANESLRVILRDIAIASKSLSPNEKLAVAEASALVAVLTKAQYDVIVDLAQAEAELDTLVLHAIDANFVWDEGLLEDAEKHYEHQIEEAQANIAQYKALREAIPDTLATLEEWKAVLDNYDKAIEVIEEQMAKNTYDSSAFFKVIVGSGIQSFNEAIAAFIEENWEQKDNDDTKWYEPALTDGQKDTLKAGAPDKTSAKYYTTSGGPADFVNTKATYATDTFPVLTLKSPIWFNKYAFLLTEQAGSYGKVTNPYDQAEPKRKLMAVIPAEEDADPDTLVIQGRIKTDMKDFILGTAEHDSYNTLEYEPKELTASYGLKGAYAVMQRVYKEAQKKYDAGKIDSLIHVTDSTWDAQNKILKAGLAAYKDYTDAVAEFEEAVEIYGAKNDRMLAAAENFVAEWNKAVTTGGRWGVADSMAVIAAIQEFAKARTEFLDKYQDTIKKYHAGRNNQLYLPYVSSIYPEYKVDTIAIADLDYNAIRTANPFKAASGFPGFADTLSKYEMIPQENGDVDIVPASYRRWNGTTWVVSATPNNHGVFDYIVARMMGQGAYGFTYNLVESRAAWKQVTADDLNVFFNNPDATNVNNKWEPLLNGWKYVPATATADAKIVKARTDEAYIPTAITAAEDKVKAKVADFIAIYNQYWGRDAVAAGTEFNAYFTAVINDDDDVADKKAAAETAVAALFNADLMKDGKLKSDSYTMEYFKPYGDKEIFVTFGEAPETFGYTNDGWTVSVGETTTMNFPKVDTTQAVLAVLTAIDPFCENDSNNSYFAGWTGNNNMLKSAIFFGGMTSDQTPNGEPAVVNAKPTTAYKALFWRYMKWVATSEKIEKDMQTIADWIEDIEGIFTTNAGRTATKTFKKTEWEKDSTNYVNAVARKKVVDDYLVVKKDFVGTHTEVIGGKDSVVLNDLYLAKVDDKVPTDVTKDLKDANFAINHASNNIKDLFATNILGDYVGWSKYLGGKQLENAKKAFGEKPYEQIQEWKDEWRAANRLKNGLKEAQAKAEAVYVAKAKVEGIDGGEESIAEMIAARADYITDLTQKISDEQDKIDTAYEKLMSLAEKNIGWDKLIAQKTAEVEAIKSQLNAINKALEQAKANLDKIMEYIKSTDAEFVIPVTLEDVDLVIETIEKALAVVGLFPDPDDPDVDPDDPAAPMTLADAIAALLSDYGMSVNVNINND